MPCYLADAKSRGSLPPEPLAKARWFHRSSDIRSFTSDYAARERNVWEAFGELQAKYQVRVVSPHEALCRGERCVRDE